MNKLFTVEPSLRDRHNLEPTLYQLIFVHYARTFEFNMAVKLTDEYIRQIEVTL